MKTLCRSVSLLAVLLFLTAAATVPQQLVKKDSSVRFRLSTGAMVLNGRLNDYRALLHLDSADFAQSKLSFTVNLSDFTLGQADSAQMVFLKSMLAKVEIEPATFESEFIKKQADGSYLVSGLVRRSGKAWEMSFYATPEKLAKNASELKLSLKGAFDGKEFHLPLKGEANVVGEIKFARAQK